MRISFDLDDTLILKTEGLAEDSLPPLKRNSIEERLRKGTRELMQTLGQQGYEIWIYSNSYRGKHELLNWFSECGLPVTGIVNQQAHEMKREELGFLAVRPSKYPPWFGIDLHIDDSLELEEDARLYRFKVLRIAPDDSEWVSTIIIAIDRLLKRKSP